jgi:starch-binding outer membrane protein, SusD/RagB family
MKNIFRFTLLILMVLGLDSCKNLVEDASTDPVNITDPSVVATTKFLSGAQVGLITSYEADVNRLTGMWTGHFSGEDRQYIPLNNYVVAARDFNVEWANIYGTLAQLNIILERAETENNPRMRGMAQIMQAMLYGLAADLWGDVPLTEALQFPDITQPKYDNQQEVYATVQSLLSQGIESLKAPVPARINPGSADVFFGSDPAQWTKVAYTLKARYYLHTKEYARAIEFSDPTLAIDAPENNMLAPHGSSYQQNFNLYYSFTTYDRPGYMAADAFAPRLMDPEELASRNNAKTNEEARLWYYYLKGGFGNFGPIAYEPNVLVDFDWGNPASANGFFGATTSFPLVTYEENLLIRAEAFAKLSNFTEALATLNTLRAYFNTGGHLPAGYLNGDFAEYWEVDQPANLYEPYVAADFDAGGIANPATATALDALLREIIEERYVTLTGQLEVFNDVRRTKNLLGVPVASGAASFPQRLLYPQSELNANAANVPQADLYTPTPVNTTPY